MSVLISILVPVYNVEEYLPGCMESILGQTYSNIEVILVDDGSTDGSGALCDEYALRDARVRVIHQPNGGLPAARNAALAMAQGQYIMFVDSDDSISLDAVQVLYEAMQRDGSEMAIGRHLRVHENGAYDESMCKWFTNTKLTPAQAIAHIGGRQALYTAVWGKLYKRRLFQGVEFPPLVCSEDTWIFPELLHKCSAISLTEHMVYYYLLRENSLVHAKTQQRYMDVLRANVHVFCFFLKEGYFGDARRQYSIVTDRALNVKNKKVARELISSCIDRTVIKELRRGQGIAFWLRLLALYVPGLGNAYVHVRKLYRNIKRH